jgi:hypothetical protein
MGVKFGLRIGNIGIEFISKEDRDKAIKTFTQGTDVVIEGKGFKYRNGEGSFSVYDRDTKEQIVICEVCKGDFLLQSCSEREYPYKHSYMKDYSETTGYICDACYATRIKDKEVWDAKKLLKEKEE